MKHIIIFGATSAIAQAFARLHAADHASFFLVARNAQRLDAVKQDLIVRGAGNVHVAVTDLTEIDKHGALIKEAIKKMRTIDIALIAHGTLSDQLNCEANTKLVIEEMKTNFLSPVSLLTTLAEILEQQGHGSIAVISSVAGDRGRQSNYIYGSAKGGLSIFTQGLAHRLSSKKINVLLIKPGFVDTPMTAGVKKSGSLWAKPERVARDIDKALREKKSLCYTPWFWRWIMLIIRNIPNRIFSQMRI